MISNNININHLKYGIDTAVDGVDYQNDDQESMLVFVCVQADHYLDDDEADYHDQTGSQKPVSQMNFITKHRGRHHKHSQRNVP